MSRPITTAARWLVTLGLLGWVVTRIGSREVRLALESVSGASLFAALLLTLITPLIAAERFRRVLTFAGQTPKFWPVLADCLVGAAYNLVLPTTMGGDVVRALRASSRSTRPSAGYASVLFERALGLVTLAAAGLLGGLGIAVAGAAWTLAAAIAFCAAVLGFANLGRLLVRVSRALRRWPKLDSAVLEVAGVFRGALDQRRPALEIGAWSLLYQLVNLSILGVVAMGWGEPRWLAAVYLGVPLALLLASIPITMGGFGLRESLFVTILGAYGISREQAFVLAALWVASSLALGVFGVLVLLSERWPSQQLVESHAHRQPRRR
jgi:hypothetical protein